MLIYPRVAYHFLHGCQLARRSPEHSLFSLRHLGVKQIGSRFFLNAKRRYMKSITWTLASLLVLLAWLPASAFESVKRPILYPNAHYQIMGKEAAQADIDDCWMMAREAGAGENSDAQRSQDAANDAAALAAAGAAAAAVLGGDPGRGAVAGAVGGGVASMAVGMTSPDNPPGVFRGIVDRCLFEKGYAVAGWE